MVGRNRQRETQGGREREKSGLGRLKRVMLVLFEGPGRHLKSVADIIA